MGGVLSNWMEAPGLKSNDPGGKTDMQVNYYAMRLKPELHEVFTEPKRAEQVHYTELETRTQK